MAPKGLMVIKDPEVAKLLSDELRRNVLHLVTHKEMSAADLVKILDKNYSSIMYHLRLLEDAGLVQKVREEIVQNKIQPYYRATAWNFHVSYYLDETMAGDEEYRAWQEDLCNRLMNGLAAYNLDIPEEKKERVKELLKIIYLQQKKEFEERQEMRAPDIQLEPHVGKSIAHMLANVRLLKDQKHRAAAEELAKILGI
ncbi:helix-turn-helix domain-containing protein [Candidatus Bathyarchaeota archaeon]|nr:helix-turn-helix domain-containing protein [Candidatus Bathyarchaeota archaeon]